MFPWYVINTYSGHENKVRQNILHRAETMGQSEKIRRVVVPTEMSDRDQERPEGRGLEAHSARLRARVDGRSAPGRRRLARGEGHARRDRVRRRAGTCRRSRKPEVDQILHTQTQSSGQAARDRRVLARRDGQGRSAARSRTSTARSSRSTRTRSASRCPSRSSSGRCPSTSSSTRSRSSTDFQSADGREPVGARVGRLHHQEVAHGQEGHEDREAADPGRAGQSRPAGRSRARPARRQHHGVLQGVQRPDLGVDAGPRSRRSRSRSSKIARSPSSRRRRPRAC